MGMKVVAEYATKKFVLDQMFVLVRVYTDKITAHLYHLGFDVHSSKYKLDPCGLWQ